jgi:hypothetical protein
MTRQLGLAEASVTPLAGQWIEHLVIEWLIPCQQRLALQRWQLIIARSTTHQARGQTFDERAGQGRHPSGADHGETSLCRC